MILWLKDNLGTVIIGLILLVVVAIIIVKIIKRKKTGKCVGCDCCQHCDSSGCAAKKGNKQINTKSGKTKN